MRRSRLVELGVRLGFGLLLGTPSGFAASQVGLDWMPSPDDHVVAYHLYYGVVPGMYTVKIPLGNVTNALVDLPVPGLTYYLAVTAQDEMGLESDYSNEVSIHRPLDGSQVTLVNIPLQVAFEDRVKAIDWGSSIPPRDVHYIIANAPQHGELRGAIGQLKYIPDPDYYGPDFFRMLIVWGPGDVRQIAAQIEVEPVPDPPVTYDFELEGFAGKPIQFTLLSSDVDSTELTYRIVTGPKNGELSGVPPNMVYTPKPGFVGTDQFVYLANDGYTNSARSTGTIVILPLDVNAVPLEEELSAIEDTPVELPLWNDVPAGIGLVHEVVQLPEHGSLSGTPPVLTYTPHQDYAGPDTIKYVLRVGDNLETLAEVRVAISVAPANDPPLARDISITVVEGRPALITLAAEDIDDEELAFKVLSSPAHGTLTGDPPFLHYEAMEGFSGEDEFTYQASDATSDSAPATVRIEVIAGEGVIPRIKPVLNDEGLLVLSWGALPGRTYRVQYKPSLNDTEWIHLGTTNLVSGDTLTWPVDPQSTSGFYAVELLLP